MPPQTRQRISYVLPLDQDRIGHRLGVNGLAVDEHRSILYSAGRDGVICAWSAGHATAQSVQNGTHSHRSAQPASHSAKYLQHTQAHFHWINDLSLVDGDSALVSASSDSSVKIWRPHAQDKLPAQTIGHHKDYVRRVVSPSKSSTWVASGGLDHQVFLWDLSGAGSRLQINTASEDAEQKGSIYALAATESLIATGGPENLLKLWDPRSGKRIVSFVGHTNNIKDLLISSDHQKIVSASSDCTVKVWSLAANRCIQTLGMHDESVWALKSDDPSLSVFYSGDKSGLLAKTDMRFVDETTGEGLSIALCKEQEGIVKIATLDDCVWPATWNSSLNCWQDIDIAKSGGVHSPDSMRGYRWRGSSMSRSHGSTGSLQAQRTAPRDAATGIPHTCLLRSEDRFVLQMARTVHSLSNARKASLIPAPGVDVGAFSPLRKLPIKTIEGQDGLRGHVLLNDKLRVLTTDTTGNIVMWDLILCAVVKSFGKDVGMQDIADKINEPSVTSRWCTVDTSLGTLAITVDDAHGFDAEIYADQTPYAKDVDFKEDQRINVGKWILRYLFSEFLNEEMRRDEQFRRSLISAPLFPKRSSQMGLSLQMPSSVITPRANGLPLMTPGLTIGVAPAGAVYLSPALSAGVPVDATRPSTDAAASDYFSQAPAPSTPAAPHPGSTDESGVLSPNESVKTPLSKEAASRFGARRLFSNLNKSGKMFGMRGKADELKSSSADERLDDSSDTRSSQGEITYEDNLKGFLLQIRAAYTDAASRAEPGTEIPTFITPSLPNETPVIRPPRGTTVIIQEDNAASGGAIDLFEGRIENLALHADLIESVAPTWLAEALLRASLFSAITLPVPTDHFVKNRTPRQEPPKIAFVMEPYQNLLPRVCNPDGSERLNANRMLRARKICAYVADRLEPPVSDEPDPDAMPPETFIDLFCNDQPLTSHMTLAWIKAQIWKNSADIVIQYKANGSKAIHPRGNQLWYDPK